MLTGWLTITAFLAASANPERAAIGHGALTVEPIHRVKGHPEAALTLNCGDGENAGVVQYWHTPFGELRTSGSPGEPDPVFMQGDGSLKILNTGRRHSGMYYCLLRHTEGTTLWPYELHVDSEYKRSKAFSFSRDLEPEEASDGQLAGAVAASVLLTFVVGFSAGALSRMPVLRCLGAVTRRLRSQRQQRCRTEVIMTSLPPTYNNQAQDDNNSATTETTSTPPPVKPQRSFRQKHQEDAGRHRQDATAYLEGCDHMEEEEEAGGSQKERNRRCDEETEEERESGGFDLEDRGSQSETDEDKCSEDVEEQDGESEGENEGWRQKGEVVGGKEEGEESRGSANKEKGRDQEGLNDREKRRDDGETGRSKQEVEGDASSAPARRSRVIRLYQYDEDGRRYDHLPEAAAATEPRPAPRLKQRSTSLTRLNAIMAAASAGPLDRKESGRGKERPRFHMEI